MVAQSAEFLVTRFACAEALGVTIPTLILARAEEVVDRWGIARGRLLTCAA
jgi:hypothetical protein